MRMKPKVQDLGEFIRSQRAGTQMSLRKLAKLAGVSNPYLSQVERGLRRPSAEILSAIAKALRVSSQTLYVKAGILEEQPHPDVHTAVMADPILSEQQKKVLLQVYDSFREETGRKRTNGKTSPRRPASPPRIVLYRRPLLARADDEEDLGELVLDVVVEEFARLLDLDPRTIDPGYDED